jgi:hypothetical protein
VSICGVDETVNRKERTDTQMCVDGRVASGARQVLVLPVRDVEMGPGTSVLLGETEIDDIDLIASSSNAHQKVIGLDVPVDEIARVNILNSRDLKSDVVR